MTLVAADRIAQLKAGVDKALGYIETALSAQVLAQKLPFVGDKLQDAFDTAESTINQIRDLKETIFETLDDLNNLPEYAEAQIETAINDALKAANFLQTAADVIINGTDVQISFTCDEVRTITLDLASDLGLGGLGISTSGQAQVELTCAFDFTVGADASGTDAFYLVTNGGAPELALGISVTAPQLAADASLGFLNFNATDMGSSVTGAFTVDLKADADGKLRLSEIDSGVDVLDATFTGRADIDIHLSGDMGAANLPKISADVAVDWAFDNSTVNPDGGQPFGGTPKVVFNNVSYDFGTFVEDFIKPILAHLDPVLQPIDKALAIFRTDLTFLKVFPNWEGVFDKAGADEGGMDAADGKITLIDFVKMAQPNANLTGAVGFIELVDDIVDWAAFFQGKTFGPDEYDLGSFEILEDIRDAAVFLNGIAPDDLNAVGDIPDLATFLGGLVGGGYSAVDSDGQSGQDILEDMLLGDFFNFPILTNPMEAFHFLLGGQADLFSLDLPALSLNFGGDLGPDGSPAGDLLELAVVPIVPGISINLEGAIEVAMDMAFGFDTRGLMQFKQSGFTDYAAVFNGFFVSDQQGDDGDIPEVSLSVLLQLAVNASIPFATVGGAGNIAGQIILNLNDIVNGSPADGKIYLDEMGNALLTNPFGIFDMSGQITAGFAAFVNVAGYDLWRYNSPRHTLGGFSFSDVPPVGAGDTPPPLPDLGTLDGTNLVLNIGDRAHNRATSNRSDGDETFEMGGSGEDVSVLAFSRSQQFDGVGGLIANGGAGDDAILLAVDLGISATLDGGSGSDYLYGGAAADVIRGGTGRDYLHGRAGGDRLEGQDGDDVLDGGAGADTLDGGADFDIVTYENSTAAIFIDRETAQSSGGDAEGDTYTSIEVFEGSNLGNDTMLGSAGSDIFLGLLGDDRLEGRAGSDVLLGGEGNDTLSGGLDDDTLYGGGGNDSLDGGEGADVLRGGSGDDLYLVDHQGDSVYDHDGADAGGYDRVISSLDFTLVDGSGIEELVLTGMARSGTGNSDRNLIIGTAAADLLNGGGGADTLEGGAGDDTYVFDSLGDRVLERASEGTDEIRLLTGGFATGATFSLDTDWGAQVENVKLTDDAHGINLTGNALDNVLIGNRGANVLRGLDGNDTFVVGLSGATKDETPVDEVHGGQGFDHLVVDWSGLTEAAFLDGDYASNIDGYSSSSTIGGYTRLYHYDVERYTITTGSGNDTIETGAHRDVIVAGAGDDIVRSGSGWDQVDGGSGNDSWSANWSDVTEAITLDLNASNTVLEDGRFVRSIERLEEFRTGAGVLDDVITLNRNAALGPDAVYTQDGSDTVYVFGGTTKDDTAADAVHMGAGADDHLVVDWSGLTEAAFLDGDYASNIDGYSSSSTIGGYTRLYHYDVERYTITTGSGNDTIETGAHRDVIVAGAGDDIVRSGSGWDQVDGGSGNDSWSANWSDVTEAITLDLNASNTVLEDGRFVRSIERLEEFRTGAGVLDDVITLNRNAALGPDTVYTQDGSDTVYVFGGTTKDDTAADAVHMGAGADDHLVVDWSGLTEAAFLDGDYASNIDGYSSSSTIGGYTRLYHYDVERYTITTGSGNDTIETGAHRDVIVAGAGDDIVRSGSGWDQVDGGSGNDSWSANWSDVTEAITLDLDASNTVLEDGRFVRSIERLEEFRTGAGVLDDVITLNRNAALGPDTVYTQDGSDTVYVFGGTTKDDTAADAVHMGAGADDHLVVDWSGLTEAAFLDGDYASNIDGYSSSSTIGGYTRLYHYDVERYTITTGSGNDTIETGAHRDVIVAGAGDDIVRSGSGWDQVDGGSGNDSWSANWSDVTEAITLDLNASNTVLEDGRFVRSIERLEEFRTGAGVLDDVITLNRNAALGPDTVYTQDGSDTVYVFGGTTKDDTAADAVHMGAGADDHLVVDWSGLTEAAFLDGDYASNIDGYSSSSTIGGYTRLYHYDVERYTITTGSGNDTIETGAHRDVIVAGAGDDIVRSGSGDDTLSGGAGDDNLIGGGGNDTALFRGYRTDYRFAKHHDGTTIVMDHRSDGDGQDTIDGIEFLTFLDGTAQLAAVSLEDQSVREDEPWSFQISESAYTDQGQGLDYMALLADGSDLPDWLKFDAGTRTFSGTPPQNFNGTIDLTVVASSSSHIALSSLRLMVTAVNDAPILADPIRDQSVAEETPWSFQIPADAFADVDHDALTYEVTLADGSALPDWLIFNAGTRIVSGTPPLNFNGTLDLLVTAGDGALTTPSRFTLIVTPVDDMPAATMVNLRAMDEDGIRLVTSQELLAGVSDGDGPTPVITSLTLASGHGGLINNGDGTWTYMGAPNDDTAVTFTYTVQAGDKSISAMASLDLAPVNDAPVVSDAVLGTATEDGGVSILNALANATDVDAGATLVVEAPSALPAGVTYNADTQTFVLDPTHAAYQSLRAEATMTVTVSYGVSDGSVTTPASVSWTVTGTNDAPVAAVADNAASGAEDTTTTGRVPVGSDVDGDALSYELVSPVSGLTFNPDGTFTYAPAAHLNGTTSFQYRVVDAAGLRSAAETFTLTVTPVNDTPLVVATRVVATAEDTPLTGVAIGASDVDGDGLSYTLKGGAGPQHGSVTFDEAQGTFSYSPGANYHGTDSFIIVVSDGKGGTAEQAVSVAIAPVTDAPTGLWLSNGSVLENSPTGTVLGDLSAWDLDGDALSYALLDSAGGRFALQGSQLVVAKGALLDYEQAASHSVVVRAMDPSGLSIDQILTITLQDLLNETSAGTSGNDIVSGGAGVDRLSGGAGNDSLNGGAGKDVLNGGTGNDRLTGGAGQDTLTGGKGKDVFVFGNKDTSASTKRADYITDFSGKGGDRIDLRGIDADVKKKGDQNFSFIGTNPFSKAGQVRYEKKGKETYVYLNTDRDTSAEGVIKLKGAMDLQKSWFVL